MFSDRAMSLWESSLQEKEREREEEREMWENERDEKERLAQRFKAEHEEQRLELGTQFACFASTKVHILTQTTRVAKQMQQLKEQMQQLKSTVVERELRIRHLQVHTTYSPIQNT